ncbi:L-lactate dehydrogenase [Rosistilla oblonga]|uniref:L-lactate dehydrogenase n=2 Tax=Rosistilla TaxID=2795779 RepID=A0A518IYE9_9BACT|nr:L-lactate dehydrogenase [Rosistilla oblonga]
MICVPQNGERIMKVSIIGGGGLVGSCAGYALQCGGIVREIALLDVNAELAVGQALDMAHGAPSVADQVIVGGGYEHIPSSDVICITAGLRRKPDESRLDLINRNTDLFVSILDQIKAAGLKEGAIVVVVSNPVDILTYVAAHRLGLPKQKVIGLGTQLDTIRFCCLISSELKAPPTQTKALILGEHGDSMVPIWSSATIAGLPLDKYPGWNPNLANQLFTRTKGSGAEVIKRKGGAGFAVGIAIRDVIESIALNSQKVLPVSSIQEGCYGIRDVALSVPTVVGRCGVVDRHEIDLWPKEVQGLRASGAALRKTLEVVLNRVG